MSEYIEKTKRVWGEPDKSYGNLQDCTKRLEDENAALCTKLEAAEKERDAAVEDIKRMDRYIATNDDPYAALCQVCKHKPQVGEKCKQCDVHDNTGFEWRGPKDGEKGEEG